MPTPSPKPDRERSKSHHSPMDMAANVNDSCRLLAKSIFCVMVKGNPLIYITDHTKLGMLILRGFNQI